MPSALNNDNQDQEQPFISHLIELRTRLIRAIASVLVIFVGLIYFANDIYALLALPLRALLPAGATMIATDVTSTFTAPLKLTFMVSFFVAIPYVLAQIWGFVSPALYKHEKRIAVPLLTSSVILFYTGVAFAYFLILPAALKFFVQTTPEGVMMMTDINQYLDFMLKLFLVFGFAFEIPVATFLLLWTGIVTPESLADKRRYVIVGMFFIAMFVTPPDALSMLMLAIPMCLLFEAGLLFGKLVIRNRASSEDPA